MTSISQVNEFIALLKKSEVDMSNRRAVINYIKKCRGWIQCRCGKKLLGMASANINKILSTGT
jgi:hypothetical protein